MPSGINLDNLLFGFSEVESRVDFALLVSASLFSLLQLNLFIFLSHFNKRNILVASTFTINFDDHQNNQRDCS